MKWWLIVFLLTANGWEPGENFDGWWASKQASFEACVEHRDFANKVNADTSLANKICFVAINVENDLSVFWLDQPGDAFHQRALAIAIGTQ